MRADNRSRNGPDAAVDRKPVRCVRTQSITHPPHDYLHYSTGYACIVILLHFAFFNSLSFLLWNIRECDFRPNSN